MEQDTMASKTDTQREFGWPFGRKNYLLFGLGIVSIVLGYITLANTAVDPEGDFLSTLSPALLVLGYCVLIPVSIIIDGSSAEDKEQDD